MKKNEDATMDEGFGRIAPIVDGAALGVSESNSIFHYFWCEKVERRRWSAYPDDTPEYIQQKGQRFFLILSIDLERLI
ncbi:uncharacterized protein V6R79_025924 [Siganus canaliculatus]